MKMVKGAKLAATEVESYYPSITLLFQVHDAVSIEFWHTEHPRTTFATGDTVVLWLYDWLFA